MNSFRYPILIIFLVFFLNPNAKSENNVYFIDLDVIVENSKLGKNLINNIDIKNKKNIDSLKIKETNIKKEEKEINKVKNVLSEDEFKLRINKINKEITLFNDEKKKLIEELNELKINEYNNFFQKISPIIQDYMEKNSINILLSKKNIFIGKSKYDITNEVIKLIDQQF